MFEQEVGAGTVVHLGRRWELHATLTGSDRSTSSVPSHVVLGGTVLGHSEETQTMVIALRPHEVAEVAAYLEGVDAEKILSPVEELRDFYAGAAKDGTAVVKLLY